VRSPSNLSGNRRDWIGAMKTPSFAADIVPLFRSADVQCMTQRGVKLTDFQATLILPITRTRTTFWPG
jgi:hypothetical protein